MKTGLLLIALLLLALWFQTTPTFCRWMAKRNFQARMEADGRYGLMNRKLSVLEYQVFNQGEQR